MLLIFIILDQSFRHVQKNNPVFPDAEGRKIIQLLQEYEKEVARKATLIKEIFQPSPSLEEITASILPVDGSVIQYSKVKPVLPLTLIRHCQTYIWI